MGYDFSKIQATGNDFILIEDWQHHIALSPAQVARLCDRHFGIGADGIILIRGAMDPDCVAYMYYINADGSLAEMCGNGSRCLAKYLVDNGFAGVFGEDFSIETGGGPRLIQTEQDTNGKLTSARVNMGKPTIKGARTVSTPFGDLSLFCVDMPNPHAVLFLEGEDVATKDITAIGPYIENLTSEFPERTNVEFAQVQPGGKGQPDRIEMRVWERGVGETLSCGTGACAVAVAAASTGRAGRAPIVHVLGGDLGITWQEEGDVLLKGPAVTVYTGRIDLDSIQST